MLRRAVLRARRRISARTAGHESSDLEGPVTEYEATALDRLHSGVDGALTASKRRDDLDTALPSSFKLERLHARAKRHILTVQSEEESASAAWLRLQQLYEVFCRVQRDHAARDAAATRPRDEGLRTLLATVQCPPGVVLRDLEAITEALPDGFTSQMFTALGNSLYDEMVAATQRSALDRDAFESLGDHLYAVAVAA